MSRNDELTNQEITKQLDISVNTIKYHIKQALHILRSRLKDYLITLMLFFYFFL
ncbi:MAG: winged helix-turn-helix transcriptional regulator [Tannerellaceae bacterium]|nr:winged helix-turn-helix transcriptional regulator [Tannerellaceae bacterium]